MTRMRLPQKKQSAPSCRPLVYRLKYSLWQIEPAIWKRLFYYCLGFRSAGDRSWPYDLAE
jgi:hypothetical protein